MSLHHIQNGKTPLASTVSIYSFSSFVHFKRKTISASKKKGASERYSVNEWIFSEKFPCGKKRFPLRLKLAHVFDHYRPLLCAIVSIICFASFRFSFFAQQHQNVHDVQIGLRTESAFEFSHFSDFALVDAQAQFQSNDFVHDAMRQILLN